MFWRLFGVATTIGSASFAVAAQVDPMTAGERLGNLSASAVLGVVAVACVLMTVYRHREAEREQTEHAQQILDMAKEQTKALISHGERLAKLIEDSTRSEQTTVECLKTQAGILVEVKDAIIKCRR